MEKPEGTLVTKIGTLRYAVTDGSHVFIGTSSGGYQEQGDRTVSLRGVDYYLTLHLFLQQDGSWDLKFGDRIYLNRVDWKEPSQAAKRDVTAIIKAAWNEFITGKDEIVAEAAKAAARDRIEEFRQELADLQANVEAKKTELASEIAALEALEAL